MTFLESLRWRYAAKKFDRTRQVSEQDLEAILEAGNLAATSYGLQPFKFVVIQDPQLQEKLVSVSFNQNQVAEASHVIVIATRTDLDVDYVEDYTRRIESVRGLPEGAMDGFRNMMVGSISDLSRDELDQWNARQAYIALGTMMAAAATLKIDTCPMEGFLPEQYDRMLGLAQQNLQSLVVLPIGYRAQDDANQHYLKVRWPQSEIVVKL